MPDESDLTRFWREHNAHGQTLNDHETRLRLSEERYDRMTAESARNYGEVVAQIGQLSNNVQKLGESMLKMQIIAKASEDSRSHIFDRWLPLVIAAGAVAVAFMGKA
jgi:hypothetical protein